MALPLEVDGKWEKLPYGQSVSGHVCVKGGFEGDAGEPTMYTVGGTSSSPDFTGIQRYSFQRKVWETLTPDVPVAQNLQFHAASYLTASSSLLVFAGSADGNTSPSSNTFTVQMFAPYHAEAYNSYVPPAVSPNLLTWDDERAVMVGGSSTNTQVYTFSDAEGWLDTGILLESPLPDVSQVRCALVNGDDGSKVLETFDMAASPNSVNRIVLLGAGGTPAAAGTEVGMAEPSNGDGPPAKRQKRDLTLADYPPYNDNLAPTVTRTNFELAQDSNGWVVLSGGNDQEPLSIFDTPENKWVNSTKVFTGAEENILSHDSQTSTTQTATTTTSSTSTSSTGASTTTGETSTISSASTTGSSSPTSTTDAAAAAGAGSSGDDGDKTMTIIGGTLGGVFGLAALLIIILIILRWQRKKKKAYGGRGDDYKSNGNDRFSFQDQGIQPLSKAGEPMARGPVPMARGPVPSADSMAIISGRFGDNSSSHNQPRGFAPPMNEKTLSPLAAPPMRHESVASGPSVYSTDQNGLQEGDRRTDVGWSKYFQGNSATNLVVMESARSTTSSTDTRSDYRGDAWPHDSATVPPLDLGRLDEPRPIASVNSGSPTTEYAESGVGGLAVQSGMTARISSGYTASETSYEDDRPDAYSSGVPASINEHSSTWNPMSQGGYEPSSRYTASEYQSGVNGLQFPPVPNPDRPLTQWPGWQAETGNSERGASTIIRNYYEEDEKRSNVNSDMSWLNLGNNNNNNNH
ncbi:hypothetical protein FQN54_003929 [Arachnomyces sp. PD_36]|nr:hypothetical protein FQN54_003929 [Arachnomyces sp. PD_36]